jgi:hypothetical protein
MEFCRIHFLENIVVKSTIVGYSNDAPFKADYQLHLSSDWVVSFFQVKACLGNVEQSLELSHNGIGNWYIHGREEKRLQGCVDIDISITPFTNSIPVNRIQPSPGVATNIEVVYLDVLNFDILREPQQYTQLNSNAYRFSSDGGNFLADITMDDLHLVTHYPGLFQRMLTQD